MDIFNFDMHAVFSFFLTFFRISIVLFLLPFFGGQNIPNTVKAALCIVLALTLWPQLSFSGYMLPENGWSLLLVFMGELILGLILGLIVNIVFSGVQVAGEIISFQMGLSMMTMVEPSSGTSTSVLSNFLYLFTLVVFLLLDGHIIMMHGLSESFGLVPPGALLISPYLTGDILKFSAQLFIIGLKVSAPVLISLFLVEVGLAMVARMAPQMNVLILGFPLKVGVGFFFFGLILSLMPNYLHSFIVEMVDMFSMLLRMPGSESFALIEVGG